MEGAGVALKVDAFGPKIGVVEEAEGEANSSERLAKGFGVVKEAFLLSFGAAILKQGNQDPSW